MEVDGDDGGHHAWLDGSARADPAADDGGGDGGDAQSEEISKGGSCSELGTLWCVSNGRQPPQVGEPVGVGAVRRHHPLPSWSTFGRGEAPTIPVQRPPTVPLDVMYPNLPVLNSCAVEEELLVHGGVAQPPPPPPAPRPPPPAYRPPSAGGGARGGRGANGRARGGRRFVELTPAAHINAIARQLMASTKEAFGVDWDDVGGTHGERSEGTDFSTKTVQEDTRRNGVGERHSTVPEHGAESALHGGDARYNIAVDTGDASSMSMTPAAAAAAVSSDDVCGGSGGALDWTQEGRRDGQLHAAFVDSISDDAAVSVENYVTLCSTSVGDGQRSDVNALRVYASKNGASRGTGSDTITLYASVDAGGEVGVGRGTADLSVADSETTSASEGEEWRRGDQETVMAVLSESGAGTMSSTLSELAALEAGGSDVVAGSSSVEVADAEPVSYMEDNLAATEMVVTTMPVGGSEVPSDNRSAWAIMLEDCPSADVKAEPSDGSETPWSQSASMDPVGALLSSGTGHRSTSPSPPDTPSTAVSQDSQKSESSDHRSTDQYSRKKSSKKKRRRTPSKSDKTKSFSRDAAGTARTTPTKKLAESSSSGRSRPSSEKARKDSSSSGHRSRSKTKHDSKNGRTTPQKTSPGKSSPRKSSSHRSSSQKSSSHKSSSHKSSQSSSLRKSSSLKSSSPKSSPRKSASQKSSPSKSSSKRSSPRKSSAKRSSSSHKPSGSKSSSQKPSPGKSTPCRSSPRKPSSQRSSEKSSSHKSSSHKTSSQKSSVPTHARDKGSSGIKKHSKPKVGDENGKTTPHASSASGSHLSAFDKLLLDSSSPKQRPKPKATAKNGTAASRESSDSDAVGGGESLSAFDKLLLDSPSTSRLVKSKSSAKSGSATPLKPTGQKSTPSKSSDSGAEGRSLPSFDQLLQGTSSATQPPKVTCISDERASSVVHGSTSVWADMLGDCPSADHPAQRGDTSNILATSFGEASGSGKAPGARCAAKESSGEGDSTAGSSTIGALLSAAPATASRSDGGRSLLKELLADCPSADADQLTLKKLLEDCLSARPSRGAAAGTSGAGAGGSSTGGGRSVLKELLADCPSADPRRLRLKQLLASCPSADPGRLRLKELLGDCPSADSEPEVVVLGETQRDPNNPSSGDKSGNTDDNQTPPRDER